MVANPYGFKVELSISCNVTKYNVLIKRIKKYGKHLFLQQVNKSDLNKFSIYGICKQHLLTRFSFDEIN